MRHPQYSKLDCIQALRDFYEKHGTVSSYLYTHLKLKPSIFVFSNWFDGWNDAVQQAGLKVENSFSPSEESYSREEIINTLTNHIKIDYKLIFLSEYKKSGLSPSSSLISNRFNSWRNAMIAIGLDMDRKGLAGRSNNRYKIAKAIVNETFCKHEDFMIESKR